ncbi:MAG: PIN domain-containing protein [Geitlerinemataceae cyanobacterium]
MDSSANVSVTLDIPQEMWESLQHIAREKGEDARALLRTYLDRGVKRDRADSPKRYLLDTCIFNKLVEGSLHHSDLPQDGRYVITHAQLDEINNTPDTYKEKRARLVLSALKDLQLDLVPTSDCLADFSRVGMAYVSDSDIFDLLKAALDKRRKKSSNTVDALLASSAIQQGLILITTDRNLSDVAQQYGCDVVFLESKGLAAEEPNETVNKSLPFFEAIAGIGASDEGDISENDEEFLRREIHPIYGWSTKPNQ